MARYELEETEYDAAGAPVAIVAARFNDPVVTRLLESCLRTLSEHGVAESDVSVIRVPGSFELPLGAKRAAAAGAEAVIALGTVIRGETPHFDFVADACARGTLEVSLAENVPVIFGVLTTETLEQAMARSGGSHSDKGRECALAALEMITVLRQLAR